MRNKGNQSVSLRASSMIESLNKVFLAGILEVSASLSGEREKRRKMAKNGEKKMGNKLELQRW